MPVILSVIGASGGVGTSTVAAGLAAEWAARQEAAVALVDGDPPFGRLDLVCGLDTVPGLRWPDLAGLRGRPEGGAIRARLPRSRACLVLSGASGWVAPPSSPDLVGDVVRALADDAPVIVDAGRDPGRAIGDVVVVSRVGVGYLADLERVAQRLEGRRPDGTRGLIVVAPRRWRHVAAELAERVALPLLGVVRADPAVRRAFERGTLPGRRWRSEIADVVDAVLGGTGRPSVQPPAAGGWESP